MSESKKLKKERCTMGKRLTYANKVILAPMVRVGTLPTRLLALDYGADIVYCEELIDHKMLQCERIENDILGTVDFVTQNRTIVFRTCNREKDRVVFQMGTADPERALKVAKLLENDVAGIDVNMGCPKEYSTKGGMGSALLTESDKVHKILTTLVQGISKPVTCKMRLLPTTEETLALARTIESTGVAALAVHGRTKVERPQHAVNCDAIKAIANTVSIPVIANGGSKDLITSYDDIHRFRQQTGASSVMIAREAQWDPSIFRPAGKLSRDRLIKDYLKYAVDFENAHTNSKFCVLQLLRGCGEQDICEAVVKTGNMAELCKFWDMEEYYQDVSALYREARERKETATGVKKRKLEDGTELYEMNVKYCKKDYTNSNNPQAVIQLLANQHKLPKPQFTVEQDESSRNFRAIVTINNKKYTSTQWEISKCFAKQGAAKVCLHVLGLLDTTPLHHKQKSRTGAETTNQSQKPAGEETSQNVVFNDTEEKVIEKRTAEDESSQSQPEMDPKSADSVEAKDSKSEQTQSQAANGIGDNVAVSQSETELR